MYSGLTTFPPASALQTAWDTAGEQSPIGNAISAAMLGGKHRVQQATCAVDVDFDIIFRRLCSLTLLARLSSFGSFGASGCLGFTSTFRLSYTPQ